MRAPKNKHEAIDLFVRGRFGNTIPTFLNPYFAMNESAGPFVIRYKGRPGEQGPAMFGIKKESLLERWNEFVAAGWEEKRLYVNDEIDREKITFQGEVMLNDEGWLVRGRLGGGCHMREAMAQAKAWKGSVARYLLNSRMDASSWEDFQAVLEEWPDAVIELVTMSTSLGHLSHTGRNTIIWEVRGY